MTLPSSVHQLLLFLSNILIPNKPNMISDVSDDGEFYRDRTHVTFCFFIFHPIEWGERERGVREMWYVDHMFLFQQVISLEGWTDVLYFVQDAHSFWNWLYFVLLIVVSVLYNSQKSSTFQERLEKKSLEPLLTCNCTTKHFFFELVS